MLKLFFLFSFFYTKSFFITNSELGKKLFEMNCIICHPTGQNIIIPEKNLRKDNLERIGMNSIEALTYQISNGKNGMPAFGDRLTQNEIQDIGQYILVQSLKNFEN